jgi:hypothetical protein
MVSVPSATKYRQFWRNVVGATAAAFAVSVGITGLLEATGQIDLPLALEPLAGRLPVIFPLHMAAGALALILIAAALSLRDRPALHRPVGRTALAFVLVGGAAALPSALSSSADTLARAGFFAQGVAWLALAAVGYGAIRVRRLTLHRCAMLAMASIAFGAVVLRLMLAALDALGSDVEAWYGVLAWAAWLIPLASVLISSAVGKRASTAHKEPTTPMASAPVR